ncbi:MAG: NUDIX hydrolase [Planctomycetota bacterium]|nr:NUDIX hydrolase [Planctomycetota bacterium]
MDKYKIKKLGGDELLESDRFRVVRILEKCRDGGSRSKDVIEHPGSVGIVPFVDDERVCLINVFRAAVGRTLIEIPAGTLDRVESLHDAASRELREETGYQADTLQSLGELWMSPGILHEKMHLFVAKGLRSGIQALEPNESIEPRVVQWSEAVAMCSSGLIEDAKTVAAIFLTDRWLRS